MMDIKTKFLDEILNCPDVEWRNFGEVAVIQRGASPRPIAQYITDDEDGVPWIKIGDTSSASKYVESTAQKITREGAKKSRILQIGDFIMSNSMSFGRPYILNISGAIHDGWASISNFQEQLNSHYLYYYLSSDVVQNYWDSKINSGSVSNLNVDIIRTLPIPIPPLPIQQKIVDILDKFTKLTAELTAELTARKQQYEYYRDELLTFGDDVEWKELGEIAEYSTERISFNELNEENYVGVDNLLQDKMGKRNSNHVPTAGNSTKFYKKDILIGNIRPYLKKIWFADCTGGTNGDVLVIHTTDIKIDPQYLYQVLADDKFFDYNMQHARGAKMPRGNKAEILKYPIPIPSLNEQARIVGILDKFDALTNSMTEGLPREIELRQQQYEYYRDLLLSFPKPDGVK